MKQEYYKLPLDFISFFENSSRFKMCTELESIDQHIELLLTTFPGEHRFDPNFGCRIWEMDFENIVSLEQWETRFKQYIYDSISKYEKRITDVNLELYLRDIVKGEKNSYSVSVRKRADVYVSANMISDNSLIKLMFTLYLGPLSNE